MRRVLALGMLLCAAYAAAADERQERAPIAPALPPIRVKAAKSPSGADATRALEAYQAGDLTGARLTYETILAREPRHRAALLGVATIALLQDQFAVAEEHYLRAIEADPQDVWAQAALLNLKALSGPLATESRLKSLSQTQPGNFYPHFALGNLFAALGRWNEASRAYQRAAGADPGNPDALYNLAVALDHLRRAAPAASHYRQALAAATRRPTAVSTAVINARLAELAAQGTP